MTLPTPPELMEMAKVNWQALVAKYQKPHLGKSLWQLANSVIPFIGLWYLMYRSLEISYWLTLLLALPTAGLMVRIFIILHDCGHGSFFKSTKWNDFVGSLCGILTLTPYFLWRHSHAVHHATSGDLDRRGDGDIWTLTVREYLNASGWKRLAYRIYRNPFVMFGIAPTVNFGLLHRFVPRDTGKRERFSVHYTNAALFIIVLGLGMLMGFKEFFLVQIPVLAIGGAAGIWLFYVQHQFEDTYWRDHPRWQYVPAALQGSSYFQMPPILQWFTGNIGFHHIHHLSPKIPNYNLPKCFKENPFFQYVTTVNLIESFKTISLKLWDEEREQLIGWKELKAVISK